MNYDFCIKISAARKQTIGNVMALSLGIAFALQASTQIAQIPSAITHNRAEDTQSKRMAKGIIGQPKPKPKQPLLDADMPNYEVFDDPNGVFPRARQISQIYQT